MSGTLMASAVAALVLGAILKWYLMHGWARYYANPTSVIFPKVCPVCLGPSDVVVEEVPTLPRSNEEGAK
jgi:hypothetical protein